MPVTIHNHFLLMPTYSTAVPVPPSTPVKTRTSSKAPEHAQRIIAPFPVIETPDELHQRQTLTIESMVLGSALLSSAGPGSHITPPPPFSADCMDYCLPMNDEDDEDEEMVVAREDLDLVPDDQDDDFSLSAEEAGSLQDEDLQLDKIQQDPVSFWETPTIAVVLSVDVSQPPQRQHHCPFQPQQQQQLDHHQQIPLSVSFSSHANDGRSHGNGMIDGETRVRNNSVSF